MKCKDCIIGYYSYSYGNYHGLCTISKFKQVLEDCKELNDGKIKWHYKRFNFCPVCGKEIHHKDVVKVMRCYNGSRHKN